jgi:8-oxo-dGTP pyrophosphatase MutT (NUDIX family)
MEREFREEAEIVPEAPLRLHGLYRNAAAAPRDHVAVFVLPAFAVLRPKTPDREIAACGFFSADALPEGTTRATRARLREIRDGLPPDPIW